MAALVLTLTVEMDLVQDAIRDIETIFARLAKCHGAEFRRLERRIERLEDTDLGDPKIHTLNNGAIVFEPFPEMASIVRDARNLGVI